MAERSRRFATPARPKQTRLGPTPAGLAALVALAFAVSCDRVHDGNPSDSPAIPPSDAAVDAAGAIARDSVARAREDSVNRAQPGYVIDSVFPVEEEIRRFQRALGERPRSLSGGARDRTSLVRAFVQAIERRDERALRGLVISQAEFGYLIYPDSPNARPPYRLSPDIVWLQRSAATDKAVTRLLSQFGGRTLRFDGYVCDEASERQGRNQLWVRCLVRRAENQRESRMLRLFGPIVERDGQFKFLSLAGGL